LLRPSVNARVPGKAQQDCAPTAAIVFSKLLQLRA
jgi:hypothetical protein